MTKDYYKILDITEFSSAEEIKSAYRHLARKWHPDVAGNTPDVLAKFKEINEAYEILSDRARKADYDTAKRFYSYAGVNRASSPNERTTPHGEKGVNRAGNSNETTTPHGEKGGNKKNKTTKGFSFNWEEFLAKKYRETQYKKENSLPKKGDDVYSDIEISIFEAMGGTVKVINMLQTQVCPKCGGRKFVNGGKCPDCHGKGETSTYKRFSVKIPAGIKDKSKIRLAEEGEKGINGGKNGDLYLTIHIKEPQNYKTDGLNILKTISVTPYEAVLGANITVATLKGNVSLKITPNTQNGQKIRLAGCGIEQNNKIGDMIVTVEIQIPKNLTNEEINLYRKLQEIAGNRERIE